MTVGLPLTIPNSFARTARWFGSGEAVVDSGTRLTYAELDALVGEAAGGLRALGVEKGDRVAMVLGNSIEVFEIQYQQRIAAVQVRPKLVHHQFFDIFTHNFGSDPRMFIGTGFSPRSGCPGSWSPRP